LTAGSSSHHFLETANRMKPTLLALAFATGLATGLAAAPGKRPNVLFIFADDWGRHASAYAKLDGPGTANDAVSTPHFDRIAAEGALFRNAFVSSPSCTPCRSALLTGRHFWQTGSASILHSTWDFSQPSFPLILRKNGYHIGRTSKAWGPGSPYEAPLGGNETTYQNGGGNFNSFSQHVTKQITKGKSVTDAKAALYEEVRENFSSFLKARPTAAPCFYFFGPTNTHRLWTKGSGKALWEIDPDSLKGKLEPFLPDVPEIREDFADYLGEAQAVDAAIGVIYAQLARTGELEETIMIISGDHGAPGFLHGKVNLYDFGTRVPLAVRIGQHLAIPAIQGLVIDRLTSLIDLAPTILDACAVTPPEEMTGKSLLPILTGKEAPASADEAVFTGRERHARDAREGGLPYPQRAIRTKDFLFIINFEPDRWPSGDPRGLADGKTPSARVLENNTSVTLGDEDAGPTKAWLVQHRDDPTGQVAFQRAYGKRPNHELYDLRDDPRQMNNLAGKPERSTTQAALEKRLMDELIRTADPRVTGDRLFYERPPMAGPGSDR